MYIYLFTYFLLFFPPLLRILQHYETVVGCVLLSCLVTRDSCILRSPAGHRVRRGQLQTLKTRHVMGMGMRMRVRVDGGRRRWRKSLMKTSGHADTRVIHVMLHRRMHRVMMLGRTHRRAESGVEGLVVEIEVSASLDHVAHDTAEAQAAAGLLLLTL